MARGGGREKAPRRGKPETTRGWLGWLILCVVLAAACSLVGLSLAEWRTAARVDTREISRAEVEVEVLNGCGVQGMAAEVARLLNASGFDVVDMGNADNFEYLQTAVLDRSGRDDRARAVAQALGCGEIRLEMDPKALLDVTVIVGADWSRIPGLEAALGVDAEDGGPEPGGD